MVKTWITFTYLESHIINHLELYKKKKNKKTSRCPWIFFQSIGVSLAVAHETDKIRGCFAMK